MPEKKEELHLDFTDVKRWIGQPITHRQQLKEPISNTDIRQWCRGMQNYNPLFVDEEYAKKTKYGGLVAPQSFVLSLDMGPGASLFGKIPGTAMLYAGEELWWDGPVIRSGDKIYQERMAFDAKEVQTNFAGPTIISRGDILRINQRGEVIGRQRSTALRYLVSEARKRNLFGNVSGDPEFSKEELAKIIENATAYKLRGATTRYYQDVQVGEELPPKVLGPHTLVTFAREWCSYLQQLPEATVGVHPAFDDLGWIPEMQRGSGSTPEARREGAGRAHIRPEYATLIGLSGKRGYGYGSSMVAWLIDFVADWMGDDGFINHIATRLNFPALTGDVTWMKGKVVRKEIVGEEPHVEIELLEENQSGVNVATGGATVVLPSRDRQSV